MTVQRGSATFASPTFGCGSGIFSGLVEQHGRFAGDADVSQAIGPVAGHFQVDAEIAADVLGRFVVEPRHHQPVGQLLGLRSSSGTYSFSQFQETSMAGVTLREDELGKLGT